MRFFYRGGYLSGRGMGDGAAEGKGFGPPPWMWGVQDSGAFPFEPTKKDLKDEISWLEKEKRAIEKRIFEIEKMIRENREAD